jgi:hypothetical protein
VASEPERSADPGASGAGAPPAGGETSGGDVLLHPGGALASDEGDRLLDPAAVRLHRGPTGVLRAELPDRCILQLAVYRAFPLSDPEGWIVLMCGDEEVGTLRDLGGLDPESAALLQEELQLRYQVPHVREVLHVGEDRLEGGSWTPGLIWDLATDQGMVRLRMPNLNDHVRPLGPGRLLLLDRDGARCEIADAAQLPPASRELLRRYLWGIG